MPIPFAMIWAPKSRIYRSKLSVKIMKSILYIQLFKQNTLVFEQQNTLVNVRQNMLVYVQQNKLVKVRKDSQCPKRRRPMKSSPSPSPSFATFKKKADVSFGRRR